MRRKATYMRKARRKCWVATPRLGQRTCVHALWSDTTSYISVYTCCIKLQRRLPACPRCLLGCTVLRDKTGHIRYGVLAFDGYPTAGRTACSPGMLPQRFEAMQSVPTTSVLWERSAALYNSASRFSDLIREEQVFETTAFCIQHSASRYTYTGS